MHIHLSILCVLALALTSCKPETKKPGSKPSPGTPANPGDPNNPNDPNSPPPGGQDGTPTGADNSLKTPPNFKVAFVGDQSMSDEARSVLNLIKTENTKLLIIPGDFDYENNPNGWDKMLTETVGDMPILAAIGNHDTLRWGDYSKKLKARLDKMPEAKCEGEIGVSHACVYEGLVIALSGVAIKGSKHEEFLRDTLQGTDAAFKICVWHKNQRLLQAGDKDDETGWGVYETCREEGAIVATAHEHSYSRTHALSNFEKQTVVDSGPNIVMQPGQSFAFVSGLGGKEIRPEVIDDSWWRKILNTVSGKTDQNKKNGPWWAKIYTSTQEAKHGALFCEFHIDNNPRKGRCYFKNIANEIVDEFTLESKVGLQVAATLTQPTHTSPGDGEEGEGDDPNSGEGVQTF